MTISQCAPGCGLGRPGEGAVVARRSKGKIYNIRWGGGDVIAFIFRQAGLNRTIRPVASADNMTINQCAPGCGLGRPGEGAVDWRSIGKIDNIRWEGRGGDRLHFSSGRSKSNAPPGLQRGQHDNQT